MNQGFPPSVMVGENQSGAPACLPPTVSPGVGWVSTQPQGLAGHWGVEELCWAWAWFSVMLPDPFIAGALCRLGVHTHTVGLAG
jgi:hypothetical protein